MSEMEPASTEDFPSNVILFCSFCGKSQGMVRKLIAAPRAWICDECVAIADDICREEMRDYRLARAKYVEEVTPAVVASLFGVSMATLRKWRSEKRGPKFVGTGRYVYYRRVDLEVFWASCRVDTNGRAP